MQSSATSLEAYLQEVPEDRQECLTRLRALCQEVLTGYVEGMEYGMPGYKKDGVLEVAFASQKNYISLYILKQVVEANRDALSGLSVGKSCINYTRPGKMDFDVIRKLLIDTRNSPHPAC